MKRKTDRAAGSDLTSPRIAVTLEMKGLDRLDAPCKKKLRHVMSRLLFVLVFILLVSASTASCGGPRAEGDADDTGPESAEPTDDGGRDGDITADADGVDGERPDDAGPEMDGPPDMGYEDVDGEEDAVSPTAATQLWFCPNPESDLLGLFTEPDGWIHARGKMEVFKFYDAALRATTPDACPICGGNILPNLEAVDAFSKLSDWGIDIAIESGAVKHWGCMADVTSQVTSEAIQNVASRGGSVRYVSMDEPYIGGEMDVGGESCHYSMEQSAAQTAEYIRLLEADHPTVLIGDIEPYPYFSVAQLAGWIEALEGLGVTLPFFHIDVDRRHAESDGVDVAADLQALESFCEERGIVFGVIFWGQANASPQAYYEDTARWVDTVKGALGLPSQVIFQSWTWAADGSPLPPNLPECGTIVYSHLQLVDEGWRILVDNDALFVSQTVPATMTAGAAVDVTVVMENRGPLPWSMRAGYKLGSQGPQDNTRWGTGRVDLDPADSIDPGDQKTFPFAVTAPVEPGTYTFQWQMIQECVEWFGALTTASSVTVVP